MLMVRRSILRDAPASGYDLSRSRDDLVKRAGRNQNVTLPAALGTLRSKSDETEGAFHLRAQQRAQSNGRGLVQLHLR